jgi:glucose-6-phosphate isomerase
MGKDQETGRVVLDPSGALGGDRLAEDFRQLAGALRSKRDEVLQGLASLRRGAPPPHAGPMDAGFIDLPERLLEEPVDSGALSRILETSARFARTVDSFVNVGIGGSYMGTRALFEACGRPYHNEHPPAARGGRPRLYFAGHNVDNDVLDDLISLLTTPEGGGARPWGIVTVSKSGTTLEPAMVFRRLLTALFDACGRDRERLASRLIVITGKTGELRETADALGCRDVFEVPDDVGGRFSVLSPVGLVPAAILGLDIRKLLEGARDMTRHFMTAEPGENAVLDYAGLCYLWQQRGASCRVLAVWGEKLEALGYWYDQLVSESLGKEGRGPTPITMLNTRDLHSRGQQQQEGARDKLLVNLFAQRDRQPPIRAGAPIVPVAGATNLDDRTLPEVMRAARDGANAAYRLDGRPTANLSIPVIDEHHLGQLFQMLMLATVVEGRLMGINPYGQPGVEAYKKQMKAILGI